MHTTIITTLLVSVTILSLTRTALAAYVLADDYSGEAFFQSFEFFTGPDPTNGHVQFQSMENANATGLAGFMDGGNATNAIYMGVDSTNQAPNGRDSVRVQSQKSYMHALVIADIVHMPGSVCGTWPAFWMVGDQWPQDGEIDIVEGVNDYLSNQMTLHTNAGPEIQKATKQNLFTGQVLTQNCNVNAPDQSKNAGCAIKDDSNLTFGADFNVNGGGVYATEWTSQAIKIWFFPRGSFPEDIASSSPNPSLNWGPPTSIFTGPNFNMDDHFKNLSLVFDTTFCGDWAGAVWNETSCGQLAPTCDEYVSNNPAAFAEAYWAVNTLQVFQDNGIAANETGIGGDNGANANVNGAASGAADGVSRAKGVANSGVNDDGVIMNTGTGSFITRPSPAQSLVVNEQNGVDTPGSSGQASSGWKPRGLSRRGGIFSKHGR